LVRDILSSKGCAGFACATKLARPVELPLIASYVDSELLQ
jgi:hypothetical protein